MKKIITFTLIVLGFLSCTETVDTTKYKEELLARQIKKLSSADIISFGHREAIKIVKDTSLKGSKIVNSINKVRVLEQCNSQQEKDFFIMSVNALEQLQDGVDLSNPVMRGDELLVVYPQLVTDSTVEVIYIYLSKTEIINIMPEFY